MQPYTQTYEILSTLGKGGMGCVYLARHLRLGTLWALKEIYKTSGGQIDLLAEANMLKRLSHPALPRIIDIYEDNNSIFIVEDYIEGVSLDKRLEEVGRLPESRIRQWLGELCDVLRYLHEQKPHPIIYRDMKPANIMITPDDKIKLIDFGIAREFKQESGGDTTSLGTLGYAAPEQYGTAQSDARTDIYSLGVTLYHAITGKSPKDPPYELRPVRQWDETIGEGMEYIIAKCTRGNPDERYQSIAELQHDLKNIESFSAASRRRRIMDVAKIVACCLLIIGGGSAILQGRLILASESEQAYQAALVLAADYVEDMQMDEAEQAYQYADSLMPGRGEGHLAYTIALMNSGDMQRCAAFAAQAANAYPNLLEMAQFNYCWGVALEGLGDKDGSLERFRHADMLSPQNALYMRYLARAYATAGDIGSANTLFEQLKSIADEETTWFVYAGLLEAQGDWEAASAEYRRCIDAGSDGTIQIAAYRELSELYKGQRQVGREMIEKEIDTLLEMQRAFPGLEEALIFERLGEAYYAKGLLTDMTSDFHASIINFEGLLDLGYGRASTYSNIAIVQQRLREYDAAGQTLLQLMDRYPANADACIQMAFLITEREGRKEQQERDYSQVLAYYEQAVSRGADGANLQRLEGAIADLRAGGWVSE